MATHFTLAYWCVLVAVFLPIASASIAKWGTIGKPLSQGGFDNANPRAWLARQTDWRARANAAQTNSFEALPFFMGAVIIAHQMGAYQFRLDLLAFVYVVLRMVYIMLYVAGIATLRSFVWMLALGINIAIFFAGYH
jgi:uncharacterized MAPEG superfamily protein